MIINNDNYKLNKIYRPKRHTKYKRGFKLDLKHKKSGLNNPRREFQLGFNMKFDSKIERSILLLEVKNLDSTLTINNKALPQNKSMVIGSKKRYDSLLFLKKPYNIKTSMEFSFSTEILDEDINSINKIDFKVTSKTNEDGFDIVNIDIVLENEDGIGVEVFFES